MIKVDPRDPVRRKWINTILLTSLTGAGVDTVSEERLKGELTGRE